MNSKAIAKLWLFLSLLMICPPVYAPILMMLDPQDTSMSRIELMYSIPFWVMLLGQFIVGLLIGAAALWLLLKNRISKLMLAAGGVATVYALLESWIMMPVVPVWTVAFILPSLIPLSMTVITYVAYKKQA